MTTRQKFAGALLASGIIALTATSSPAQETAALSPDGGPITVTGCFLRVKVANEGNKFVLVKPTLSTVESVPEAMCSTNGTEPMVELDDVHTNLHKHHLDRSKLGRWIEVTGRLEKLGHQALREVHVESYRIVPVVAPRAAEGRSPVPHPGSPAVIPATPNVEVGTTMAGVQELPQTASSIPTLGLIGCLALAAAFGLRLFARTAE